jgi:hypothetical protein
MGNINGIQCGGGRGNNVAEVGIEPGTIEYNARCYNHYILVAYPRQTIPGSRSYPKKVLAEHI